MNLCFLGAGMINTGLALAAAERGARVRVWNRTPHKANQAAEDAAALRGEVTAVPTLAAAVSDAREIHLALTADEAVDEVLASCAPFLHPDAIILDHSTTSVAGTIERAKRLEASGIAFLHCPVFMSPQACREARGMMLVAGPAGHYQRVATALSQMTSEVWYLGESPGAAAATKLMGNAGILANIGVMADAMAIGQSAGLPDDHAMQLFERFNPTGSMFRRARWAIAGDLEARWTMTMARKDVRLMQEAAADRPLSVLDGLASRLDERLGEGTAALDVAALVSPSVGGEDV